MDINSLNVKIFADGADLEDMKKMNLNPLIQGLTTNPTLMAKAGITNYINFAKEVLSNIKNKPISFEVFSDDLIEIRRQAREIAKWGENVYVKIPITNTKGESTKNLIKELTSQGVKVNITAIMTTNQVNEIKDSLDPKVPSYVSIFAGRIADTGRNPIPIIQESLDILKSNNLSEVIWASPRELLNIFQASEVGCHVITATTDILKKLELVGYNLEAYSLDTVKMFRNDAIKSNFEI